jgi:pyruvate,orthophosphate dikinase
MSAAQHLYSIAPHAALAAPEDVGFKAHNLLRLARLGLAVPEAFVLGTATCRAWFSDAEATRATLHNLLRDALAGIEQASGLGFGSPRRPLLVSVRSGAPVSMPGMMDTLLDIGLCDATLRGLLRLTGNPRLAWDSYRRLVQQFAEVVHQVESTSFRDALERQLGRQGVAAARELDFRALQSLTHDYLDIYAERVGRPFPQDPYEQLEAAVGAVFQSWMSARAVEYRRLNAIDGDVGTAVTVQRMVFGNAGGTSGAGVAFTRDPTTGENRLYVDFLFNSQGEDVVSGRSTGGDAERMTRVLPAVAAHLAETRRALEQEFRDVQEFEFTVQDGRLYLLQTRAGKRTPWAALRIAVEIANAGLITPREALARVAGLDLGSIQRVRIAAREGLVPLSLGIPAGLGVAAGRVALDAAAAQRLGQRGVPVILVRDDLSTEDIGAIARCAGVLTARGSRTAHAAVVARQFGKPCVVGCSALSVDLLRRALRFGSTRVAEGEEICLDAESGEVFAGRPKILVERPDEYLQALEGWRAQAA